MKQTQQDMARILGITTVTLRNWRRDKPNLYKIIMRGFAVEDIKKLSQESVDKLESVGEVAKKKII